MLNSQVILHTPTQCPNSHSGGLSTSLLPGNPSSSSLMGRHWGFYPTGGRGAPAAPEEPSSLQLRREGQVRVPQSPEIAPKKTPRGVNALGSGVRSPLLLISLRKLLFLCDLRLLSSKIRSWDSILRTFFVTF